MHDPAIKVISIGMLDYGIEIMGRHLKPFCPSGLGKSSSGGMRLTLEGRLARNCHSRCTVISNNWKCAHEA